MTHRLTALRPTLVRSANLHAVLTLSTLVLGSCARLHASSGTAEASAFAAVVRRALSEGGPLLVDPRPLRADGDITFVTAATRADSSAEFLARRETLRSMGVVEGDAAIPPRCVGYEFPSADPEARSGCPLTPRRVLAVGIPRAGDVLTDSLPTTFRHPRWSIRAVIAEMDRGGFAYRSNDYVLEESGGRWTVLKKGVVLIQE